MSDTDLAVDYVLRRIPHSLNVVSVMKDFCSYERKERTLNALLHHLILIWHIGMYPNPFWPIKKNFHFEFKLRNILIRYIFHVQ